MTIFKDKNIQKKAQLSINKQKELEAFQSSLNVQITEQKSAALVKDNVPQEAKEKSLTNSFKSLFKRKPAMKAAPALDSEKAELHEEPELFEEPELYEEPEVQVETKVQEQTEKKGLSEAEIEKKKERLLEEGEKTYTLEYARSMENQFTLQELLKTWLGEKKEEKKKEDSEYTKDLTNKAFDMLNTLRDLADRRVNKILGIEEKEENKTEEEKKKAEEKEKKMAEVANFLAAYNDDMKKVTAAGDKTDEKYEEFLKKYKDLYGLEEKDHELIGICAGLSVFGHGNMDTKSVKKKNIKDYSAQEDIFLDKSKKDKKAIDPPIKSKDKTYVSSYMKMTECYNIPLFKKTPSPEEVKQGNLGDCYFITAINVILEKDPSIIQDMMKDEGATVLVRFFGDDRKPRYVRVKKTLPMLYYQDTEGGEIAVESIGAANNRAGLWVDMLEKAYACVRRELSNNERRGEIDKKLKIKHNSQYDHLRSGSTREAILHFLGDQWESGRYGLDNFKPKYSDKDGVVGQELFKKMHENAKEEFDKNTAEEKKDWQIERARLFFGLNINDQNREQYKAFLDDKLFEQIEKKVKDFLDKEFTSPNKHKDAKEYEPVKVYTDMDAMFLAEEFEEEMKNMQEFSSTDKETVAIRSAYIKYLKEYILSYEGLQKQVNTDGNYTTDEKDLYNVLKGYTSRSDFVAASMTSLGFAKKKDKEGTGEKVKMGIASNHAYTIRKVDTEKQMIKGKEVELRFVYLVNPWKSKVRDYDENGHAYTKYNTEGDDPGGLIRMELSDFVRTFHSFSTVHAKK